MADRVKSTKQLKLVAGFVDGDDRTITIDTTRDNFTKGDINAFGNAASAVIEGDKTGADFKNIKTAKLFTKTTTYLDLTTA